MFATHRKLLQIGLVCDVMQQETTRVVKLLRVPQWSFAAEFENAGFRAEHETHHGARTMC